MAYVKHARNRFTQPERDRHIHPTAVVSPYAKIGPGVKIWHFAQIREYATIGAGSIIGKDVYIDAGVIIGVNCKLQNGVLLYYPAVLENGVFLGPGVMTTNDRYPRAINPDGTLKAASDWQAAGCRFGEGASVGAGSIILPGVDIGCWAMVGAGSVVTSSVPEHALVCGNPARIRGYVCQCGRPFASFREIRQCDTCGAKGQIPAQNGRLKVAFRRTAAIVLSGRASKE